MDPVVGSAFPHTLRSWVPGAVRENCGQQQRVLLSAAWSTALPQLIFGVRQRPVAGVLGKPHRDRFVLRGSRRRGFLWLVSGGLTRVMGLLMCLE